MKAYVIFILGSNYGYGIDAKNIESAKKKLENKLHKKVTITNYNIVGYY